ncbi:diacylglycerol/lipid kinase family protein [Hymenobacter latericus]|uniref:diacylglycerol/lipid kinase family protein n=1 Tax=Hymenobacter sp. YIM 151858-1 TaxID=2987688 RepID=UPI0022278029|nr:diacylglycerol kinase family protein [Hymenobacter sp. YIM 151858-1]UYZ60296.1 diacylglycerol kinase family lipid kinase [Hymenobacter sp. YIM 151858-1]
MNPSTPALRRLLFVMNPISGDIDKAELTDLIHEVCASRGRTAELFNTTGENDLEKLRELIASQNYDAVFAAGGDGTVNLVAQAMVANDIPMGILPLGSGNGLSKDLGIPQDPEQALQLIWEHHVKPLDTLEVGGQFSTHLADLGFNALIVERFSAGDTRGPGAYVRVALQEYIGYAPEHYRIVTDQETWEGKAFMLTIANARTFGSNVVINPDSRMDDGRFELCVIEPFPATAAPGILYRLYTNDFDDSEYTRRLRCRHASIEVPGQAQALVQIDGEPLQLPLPIRIEIKPRSLQVLVPPPAAA